jgi:hypothetical protein
LYSLANVARVPSESRVTLALPAALQSALDGFTSGPALVFNPLFDVLAHNAMARLIYAFDADVGPYGRNHLWRLFMDPTRQRLYLDREAGARNLVGILRRNSAANPSAFEHEPMLAALRAQSPEFVRIWDELETTPLASVSVRMQHAAFGRFTLQSVRLSMQEAPGLLVVFLPPADAESAALLAKPQL